MIIKICFQGYVYLYHGQCSMISLHEFCRKLTTERVILKWVDQDYEAITLVREEDLDYAKKHSQQPLKLQLHTRTLSDALNYELPLCRAQRTSSFGNTDNQFTFPYYSDNQQHDYSLSNNPTEAKKQNIQNQIFHQVVCTFVDKYYDGFAAPNQFLSVSQNLADDDFGMRSSVAQKTIDRPSMIIHKEDEFLMRSSIAQRAFDRPSVFHSHDNIPQFFPPGHFPVIFCDYCAKEIKPGDRFYQCNICQDFDICSECQIYEANFKIHDTGHEIFESLPMAHKIST